MNDNIKLPTVNFKLNNLHMGLKLKMKLLIKMESQLGKSTHGGKFPANHGADDTRAYDELL